MKTNGTRFDPQEHSAECAYHVDQYPHECNCGRMTPKAEIAALVEARDSLRYVLNFADSNTRVSSVMKTFTLPDRRTTREKLEWLYTHIASLSAANPVPVDAPEGETPYPHAAEAGLLADIAAMMSEFVDNWPEPKQVSTALKLIAKTFRAALAKSPVPVDAGGGLHAAATEALRLIKQYAEFFCEEDYDPVVDQLEQALHPAPTTEGEADHVR